MSRPWAVVTGASSGIGREFAKLFAADGVNLVLAARNKGDLQQLARELEEKHNIEARVVAGDLSDITTTQKLHAETRELAVYYLVNNAGFGGYGEFIETDWQQEHDMINLNIAALTYLSKKFAADMVQRGQGRIVNVASTAAFMPGPHMSVYFATKAYVLSLSEAMGEELRGSGVQVTALCPGPTQTGFATAAHADKTALFKGKLPTAEEVAHFGYKAMQTGKPVAIHRVRNRVMIALLRLLPRQTVVRLVSRAQR